MAEWSFWTTGRPTVPVCLHSTMIASPRSVDDLLHKDIATLVSRAVGLADVLVAEVTEHVLDHILDSNPERSSSTAIPNYVDSTLQLSNTLPNAASCCF